MKQFLNKMKQLSRPHGNDHDQYYEYDYDGGDDYELLVCWRPYFRASMVLISRVHCLQSPPAGDFGVDDDPANPTHELTIANLRIGNEWPVKRV